MAIFGCSQLGASPSISKILKSMGVPQNVTRSQKETKIFHQSKDCKHRQTHLNQQTFWHLDVSSLICLENKEASARK